MAPCAPGSVGAGAARPAGAARSRWACTSMTRRSSASIPRSTTGGSPGTSWRWWCSTRCSTRSIRRRWTGQGGGSCTAPGSAPRSAAIPATSGRASGRRRTCICCCGNAPETAEPARPARPSYVRGALSRPLLALLLLAACATPYQPFEGRPVLAEIRFGGNNSFSGGEILKHIATAPTSGFFSKTARYYDPDLFAIDIKRIERWYNEQGFYQAKVENVQEERDDKGRVILIVKINEGPGAIIRKMDYLGLDAVPPGEMSDINDALPIHPGDPFTEEGYEKSKEVLLEQLKEHGFAQAQVRGRVEIAPQEGAAHVMFECQPGARYTFGSVNVSGNRRVSAGDIANATGIHRGDRYSPQGLALAQQRIYNLGTFSGVRVGVEPLGDSAVANVRVNVREVQQGFSYDDVAGRIGLIYRRGSHSVGGSLNFIRYFNVRLQGLQGQQNLVNVSPSAGIVQQCTNGCTLTYPELRYVFDGRDNVIEPTQGFYASIDLQQTLRPGSFSYFRINPEVRAYAPATRYAVLAMRAIYGG